MRKLTITVSEEVYKGLYANIGKGHISSFLNNLAKSHLIDEDIEMAYREMAMDADREQEANEWTEAFVGEALDETR